MTGMTEQKVLQFKPREESDEKIAGVCLTCLDSPIEQTPCPHFVVAPEEPAPPSGDDIERAFPAKTQPSERDGCKTCLGWREEHIGHNVDHVFEPMRGGA